MTASKSVLYLASQSASRRQLLEEAQIPFKIIGQDADEQVCDWTIGIDKIVLSIASQKMEHACLPAAPEGSSCIVVTADTLVQSCVSGKIFGKPAGYDDAVATLKDVRRGAHVVSGFCCEKKIREAGQWRTVKSIKQVISGDVVLDISDDWIATYLNAHPCALNTAGVLFVEGYGAQFVSTVNGSYTAVLGLPMRELRLALEDLGFFE